MTPSTTGREAITSGSSAGRMPRRTSSRKPASTIERWSAVMLPLPRPYEIAALGSPVRESRMKYRPLPYGPVVVTVQPLMERWK
jgi:hypothetical protein